MQRRTWIFTLALLISVAATAQNPDPQVTLEKNAPPQHSEKRSVMDDSGERFFLPRDAFWGWAELDCAGNAGQYGGVNAPCSMFARYMLSGILEVRPFGRGQLRRFMVYGAPTFLFGKTIPQTLYTWSPDAIGVEHSWGAGIYIGKGFEFRITQHFLFDRLGARDKNLGQADEGNNGPWGRYMTVGVRKTFGTRRW
jgi:hypothetical protein